MIRTHVPQRHLVASTLFALLVGCAAETEPQSTPAVDASPQAIVHGTIALDHAAAGHRVALLWLYWPEELCETHVGNGVDDFGGKTCTGAHVATLGTVEPTTGGFRLVHAEPPPAHVHGFDTEVAEAVVVEVPPDADPATIDLDTVTGIAPEHLVVWVPTALDVDRIEAQELGGNALSRGFYLVRTLDQPIQVEGVNRDGDQVFTHRVGTVTDDADLQVEPIRLDDDGYRVPFAPQLFL